MAIEIVDVVLATGAFGNERASNPVRAPSVGRTSPFPARRDTLGWALLRYGVRITLVVLVGCGRIGFDPAGDDTTSPTLDVSVVGSGHVVSEPPGIDCPGSCSATFPTSTPIALTVAVEGDGWFNGWSGGCTGTATMCAIALTTDTTVAATIRQRPNRVFLTSTLLTGAFGGAQAADDACSALAGAAGLTGTFVAWVSTSTTPARSRLVGSRGWIRTDGVPVADTIDGLVNGEQWNPIGVDEAGRPVENNLGVWTGTNGAGDLDTVYGNCSDWTTTTGSGQVGRADAGWPVSSADRGGLGCSGAAHVYCFEIRRDVPIAPIVEPGRVVFVSATQRTPSTSSGVDALDALCAADAVTAGLAGTFQAVVATTSESIATRITGSGAFRRVDGTRVADDTNQLFGPMLQSFVTQHADGSYTKNVVQAAVLTGTSSPDAIGTVLSTCDDWTTFDPGTGRPLGEVVRTLASRFWGVGALGQCDGRPILCAER